MRCLDCASRLSPLQLLQILHYEYIICLRKLGYNKRELLSRRQLAPSATGTKSASASSHEPLCIERRDVLFWTNEHVVRWCELIGLNNVLIFS